MKKKCFLTIIALTICLSMTKAQILDNYVTVGKEMLYSGEVDCAFESFSRGVRYNNMNARYFLGLCHEYGFGTNVNHQEAFNQFRRAAEGGNDKAKAAVAKMLMYGTGCTKNLDKAKYWIEKLLMNRNYEGFFMKGICQLEGMIYPQNTSEALANLQKAIDAGSPDACVYLATLLVEGKILSADQYKAKELINHACSIEPDNILLQDKKGEILINIGDGEEAKKLWQQLITLSPAYAIEFKSAFADNMRNKYAPSASIKKAYNDTRSQKLAMIESNIQRNSNSNNQIAQSKTTQQPIIIQQPVFQQPVSQPTVLIEPTTPDKQKNQENSIKEIISDVDRNIPTSQINNDKTFAIIIANEHYQDVSNVPYANHDGEIFAIYCKQILGLPEKNVHFIKDATLNNIKREINWIKQVADAYENDAKLIFYYAGHGIPDESTRSAYLLPVDGLGIDTSTGYALSDLYATFESLPTQSVVLFIDACFSGAARNGEMVASARGVAIKPKQDVPKGNLVIFSAAQGDETAYPYKEQGHGLFTYYLLKKLQETKGNTTLGELQEYTTNNVKKTSIVVNGKSQTPSLSASAAMANEWRNWRLK